MEKIKLYEVEVENPKFEYLNPKQILKAKKNKLETEGVCFCAQVSFLLCLSASPAVLLHKI